MSANSPSFSDFTPATKTRIQGPSGPKGYSISPTRGNQDDSARYILIPDAEFYRPWIANPPNGTAFIWPLGTQGFTYSSSATTGIHHYIGDNDVDVDVVYPDELHITLTGHFPGRTSPVFMQALRQVILDPDNGTGKILALPGVDPMILYVTVISHSFTHDESDLTSSIAYSIELIKVGQGRKLDLAKLQPTIPNPSHKTVARGKSSRTTVVKQGRRTLRQAANKAYGSNRANYMLSLANKNADDLEKLGIPVFTLPYSPLGGGTVLKV